MKSLRMQFLVLGLIAVVSACKPTRNGGSTTDPNKPEGSSSANGENQGESNQGQSQNQDAAPVPNVNQRAWEIHDEVLKVLESKHADSKDRLWFDSLAEMESDWVVQSPENYWDREPDTLPINLTCTPGSKGCDTVFPRAVCEKDDDCKDLKTTCKTLEASKSPTTPARKMCLGSGDSLLERYYRVMTSAEKQLEITTLSMPLGSFRSMLVNALAALATKPEPPLVRLLVSGQDVVNLNVLQQPTKVLATLWTEISAAAGRDVSGAMQLEFGNLSKKKLQAGSPIPLYAWNHSKIVIADQTRMISGGHNLWDPDYTRDDPVFDISMQVSGPIAKASKAFVSDLWRVVDKERAPNANAKDKWLNPPELPGSTNGRHKVIGVGRLGFVGTNPSDDAINTLIRSSTSTLHIAVQDFFQTTAGNLGALIYAGEPFVADALAEAIMKGVQVQIVQSDDTPGLVSYVMLKPRDTFPRLIDLLVKKAEALPEGKAMGQKLRSYICDHVEYAPWRFREGSSKWANKKEIAAHTKLVIADDSAFYLGSHNLYPADLQEYGLIVSDAELTQALEKQHWELLWKNSKAETFKCK